MTGVQTCALPILTVNTYKNTLKTSDIVMTKYHTLNGIYPNLTLEDYYIKLRSLPYYATNLNYIEVI